MSPSFILSPCGTSLLTNQVSDLERKLVGKHANTKQKSEVPADDLEQLESLIDRVAQKVASADFESATRMSAELNTIIKLYDGRIANNNDFHQLICTDTWLGETTANFVATWLQAQGLTVDVKRQVDLQTRDIEAFQLALSEIVEWCEQTIPGYRQRGYRIIFNLTGGFKSVQGFLQTLAAFYADETVYIFETSKDLLRIPRLPVEMNPGNVIRDNLEAFRKLALGLDSVNLDRIPETLLMQVDGKTCFSSWGDLVWKNTKDKIYQEQLFPPLSDRLKFGSNFERSIKGILPDRLVLVNNRLDQLSKFLETNGEYNPPSLDFKPLKGAGRLLSTHEVDAWNDRDAKRIFGHYEGNIFVLDILDVGLH